MSIVGVQESPIEDMEKKNISHGQDGRKRSIGFLQGTSKWLQGRSQRNKANDSGNQELGLAQRVCATFYMSGWQSVPGNCGSEIQDGERTDSFLLTINNMQTLMNREHLLCFANKACQEGQDTPAVLLTLLPLGRNTVVKPTLTKAKKHLVGDMLIVLEGQSLLKVGSRRVRHWNSSWQPLYSHPQVAGRERDTEPGMGFSDHKIPPPQVRHIFYQGHTGFL